MQNVSFRHVGELLDYLPDDQLEITEHLRHLIGECLPQAREKLSFNVPFYRIRKNVCFIWPGAVPWGSKTREGVELGFSYGHLLHDPANYLERGNRKQVFSKFYRQMEDLDEEVIRQFLFESAEVDEMLYQEKFRKGKKRK